MFVNAARKYLGVKFHHQGRNVAGLDCLGLVILAARDIGRYLEDLKGYARTPDGDKLKKECERQLKAGDINNMKEGDILLMRFRREPQHLAIKTDVGIIHSYQDAGQVVEHGLDDKWLSRIKGVYKLG